VSGREAEELLAIVGDLEGDLPAVVAVLDRVRSELPVTGMAWHRLCTVRTQLLGLCGEVNRARVLLGGLTVAPQQSGALRAMLRARRRPVVDVRVLDCKMRQANDRSLEEGGR
jgi:hypothetical protein